MGGCEKRSSPEAAWGAKLNKANLNTKAFGLIRNNAPGINALSDNQVTAIVEDSAGIIWIGTHEGGLNRWDKKTKRFTHFRHHAANNKTLRADAITAMLEDKHGHLWICNGEALSQLNKQTGEFSHYYDTGTGMIVAITEDRQGLLWVGWANGISSFDEKTGKFFNHHQYDSKNPGDISDGMSSSIFADSRNNIWIGHGSRATDRLNTKTGRISHYKRDFHDPSSITSSNINSFFEDSKGNLWLGTFAGGLNLFDYNKESFKSYTDKDGLANNTVFSILEDNSGSLWLGTRNGLSRFNPLTETFNNYNYKDGLQGNIFAAGYRERGAYCKGKDGTLYFGGSNGLNFFNPRDLIPDSHLAPVVITQIKLFDSLVKGGNEIKKIVLAYNQNYFSFEFSSLSYYNPAKNQYAYKLEGIDKDWVYSGARRYVSYTNIDPGHYTFSVKGTNNDGVWNEKGVSISVIISPPWWRTWWAYALYVIAFLFSLVAYIKWREKSLRKDKILLEEKVNNRTCELKEEKEKVEIALEQVKLLQEQLIETERMHERLRISRELHDDVGGTLSGIVLYSHLAENQMHKHRSNEAKQSLNRIQQSANEMVNKLNDIIWSVNPEHNSVGSLFQKLGEYAMEMAGAKNINVEVNLPEGLVNLRLPVNIQHNMYLLFKEAINNTVKYSQASMLRLNARHAGDNIYFSIADNGKGFDIATVKKGNGLMNMQKRADDIDTTFCLQSAPQKGTIISLQYSIPVFS